jgi:putative PIN family toxin of toxin-antitoxin system
MRVVLDTNVIIGAYVAPHGALAQIKNYWRTGVFELVVSEPILDEYSRVLAYAHIQKVHQMQIEQIEDVISDVRDLSIVVEPTEALDIVQSDPTDNKFFECATAGQADFIVSGDAKHMLPIRAYKDIQVISPAEFLVYIEEELFSVV